MNEIEIKKPHIMSRPVLRVVLALFCCLLWGGVFPAVKTGYAIMGVAGNDVGTILLFAGYRFSLAGFLIILFYSLRQKRPLLPQKGEYKGIILLGSCQTLGQYIFNYIGVANVTGVKGAVIQGAITFISIVCACFLFRQERFTRRKLISCLIGFSGIVLANLNGLDFSFTLMGEGFVFIGTVMAALGSSLTKIYAKNIPVSTLTGYQFLLGGVLLVVCGVAFGGSLQFPTMGSVLIFLYLAFSAAVAQTVWSALLKHNEVSQIIIFILFVPIFGAVLSSVILPGETISPNIALALLLVCAGIVLANFSKTKQ